MSRWMIEREFLSEPTNHILLQGAALSKPPFFCSDAALSAYRAWQVSARDYADKAASLQCRRRFRKRRSLKRDQRGFIYHDEVYLLRPCLFRGPGGRENAFVRSLHLAEPAREEDRGKQSCSRFHSGVAWAR